MVMQEVDVQRAWLSKVRDTVEAMVGAFSTPQRSIAVLDTNVLLHHPPLEEVDWSTVIGVGSVMLVVPRRVVEELDERKYVRTKIGDRARTRVGVLARYVAADAAQIRPGVDVEIVAPVDLDPDAARRQPIPADAKIIDACEALTAYAGSNPVCLVTGDLNMQTLAVTRGIEVRCMPENTMQPRGSD